MTKPIIDYLSFKNKSRDEILEVFIKYITIVDDGCYLPELKKKTWRPHLKIFIVRTYDFMPKDIIDKLKKLYYDQEKGKKFENFMNIFAISVEDLNFNNYYLKFENLESKKKFHFVIFAEKKYWTIITLTNRIYLDKTILKIIKTVPDLELIKITSRHLENLIYEHDLVANIKGFIAKYKPYQFERKITVDVYGGDLEDLDRIRDLFFVEPTSFSYSLKNSPSGVVEGKIFSEGNFTIEKIVKGHSTLAIKTIKELSKSFEDLNNTLYEQVESYENVPIMIKKECGLSLNSRYSIVMKIKEKRIKSLSLDSEKDKITYEELNDNIVKFFKNRPKRYQIYSEKKFSHFISDKFTRNKVQLTIEPNYNNIILYPFTNCKGLTLRDICNGINEVESSIKAIELYSYKN